MGNTICQHDYNVRVWKDSVNNSPSSPPTIFVSGDFDDGNDTSYDGIFFTQTPAYLSIELGTHDEHLISEATRLCKVIAENVTALDNLLRSF